MKFKLLKLNNFKSFVEKSEIEIKEGLTGIVGPNGCGKSNIIEAFKWIMGESSPKQMRSDEMDDVIFGGSVGRPSRDVAEVNLLLDNSEKNTLSEYNKFDELEIKRKIERGMGSTWYINNKIVRAKDVSLIFADISSGSKSSSIVTQGQITEIINAKPEIISTYLEEAAGIRGLNYRKHEAELKLNSSETNLERLQDIMIKMLDQKKELSKQVRQVSRYKTISLRIRSTEALLFYNNYQNVLNNLERSQIILDEINTHSELKEKEFLITQTKKNDLETLIQSLIKKENELGAKLQSFKITFSELENKILLTNENRERLLKDFNRISEDENRLNKNNSEILSNIKNLNKQLVTLKNDELQKINEIKRSNENLNNAKKSSKEADKNFTDLNFKLESDKNELRVKRTNLEELERSLIKFEAEKNSIKIEQYLDQKNKLSFEINKLNENNAIQKNLVIDLEKKLLNERQNLDFSAEKINEINLKVTELNSEYSTLQNLLKFNENSQFKKVSQILEIKKGLENSVSDTLGEGLQAYTSHDEKSNFPYWEKNNLNNKLKPPENTKPLINFIKNNSFIEKALSGVGICDTPEEAQKIQKHLIPGQSVTTYDGGLWRWDGYVIPLNYNSPLKELLFQSKRIEEVNNQNNHLKSELLNKENSHSLINDKINKLNDLLKKEVLSKASLEDKHKKITLQYEILTNKIDNFENRRQSIDIEIGLINQSRKKLKSQIKEKESNKINFINVKEASKVAEKARNNLAEVMSVELKTQQISKILTDQINSLTKDLNFWENNLKDTEKQLSSYLVRKKELVDEINNLKSLPDKISEDKKKLSELIINNTQILEDTNDKLSINQKEYNLLVLNFKNKENDLKLIKENELKSQADINLNKKELLLLESEIFKKFNGKPESLKSLLDKTDINSVQEAETLENKILRLIKERDNIGPVNLRSELELEKIQNELDSFENDKKDIEEAIFKLRHAIKKLNSNAKEKILNAFDLVNENFFKVFQDLFGGGKAKLEFLNIDDPLNSGIQILASPPGKKLQSLSLFSGGEKALTALSLLFAIFLTNPSPIFLLDEVDAPLDDTNVGMLCNFLEKIKKETPTKFIIITHHRITMSKMDRLYGVTMYEKGASQLVSVNLEKAIEIDQNVNV